MARFNAGHIRAINLLDGCNTAEGDGYKARFEPHPFKRGSFRLAFRGELLAPVLRNGQKIVVKVFKDEYARYKGDWKLDIQTYDTAKQMADLFNAEADINLQIAFVTPVPMQVTGEGWNTLTTCRKGEWVIAESFLKGAYTKWVSNNGWMNPNELFTELAATFAHWTWVRSEGKLMVCDLQGVCDNPFAVQQQKGSWVPSKLQLTDPAINSVDQSYGKTDIGTAGIYNFFRHHRCADFCTKLNIQQKRPPQSELESVNRLQQMQGTSFVPNRQPGT